MTPRRCCTHCHTLASCLAANDSCQVGSHCSQPTIYSRGAAREQQQPTGLEVFHFGIRSKRVNGSLDFLARNSCTNSGCPIGVPRTFTPCCSGRNSGSLLHTVASSLTCLADAVSSATPLWKNATSIPDLGFAKVQLNVRVSEQFFLQDGMHICNAVGLTNDVHIDKIREKTSDNLAWTASSAARCPNAKSKGMRYHLVPSLPCAMSSVAPSSSSHS